jgi:hypothetical protein
MRFPRFYALLAAALFLPAFAAHADTITGFVLTSSLASGTVQIDTTTGVVESIDLTSPAVQSGDTFAYTYYDAGEDGITEIAEGYFPPEPANGEIEIIIYLPVNTLVGYDGGAICSLDNPCDPTSPHPVISFGNHSGEAVDGTLSPTPEPSSLTLLATGVVGIAGVARRKLLRA